MSAKDTAHKTKNTDVLNEHEAAKALGVSVSTMRSWRFNGRGPAYVKMSRKVIYMGQDLEAFLLSRRVEPRQ